MPPKKRVLGHDRVVSDIDINASDSKRRLRSKTYNSHLHSLSTLPYHVLTNIFSCLPPATPPAFLLTCATLCRALHDPAIAALYSAPRTSPPARAHKLLATLRARPDLGVKVRRLEIEIEPLLTTKLSGSPWDLVEFLCLCTGLRELRFIHSGDHPTRWRYPHGLWDALEASIGTRLQSWRWDRRFIGKLLEYSDLRAITGRCFTGLRSLELLDFDEDEDEEQMVSMLALMPKIDAISFTSCGLVKPGFLSQLTRPPPTASAIHLRELSFTNCPLLTAADLGAFLAEPACASLHTLQVLKCRSCSLAFTDSLPASLARFEFDAHLLNTTTTLSSFSRAHNAEPEYDSLLPAGCVPAWPASLQTLEATSLRRWSSEECERFLSSIVYAVPSMRALRRLKVWSMLTDIDWRERSHFRERWMAEVRAVFADAEVRFDNARPAEQLWGEDDFVAQGKEGGGFGSGGGRRGGGGTNRGGTNRGRGGGGAVRGGRGKGRGRGRGRGRVGKTIVVVVKDVLSSGDEEYVDED